MTKQEIIETALKGKGAVRLKGQSYEPIMPYLLADVMYQIYQHDIVPLGLSRKLKQMDSLWRHRYGLFNRPLFSKFAPENYDELTDMMDSVGDYLSNEITMLRSAIMQQLSGISNFEHRKAASSFLLCHCLAQYAECSYENVYVTYTNKPFGIIEEPAENKDLIFFRDYSYKMAMEYIQQIPGGELYIGAISTSGIFNLIAKKIYKWLKEN